MNLRKEPVLFAIAVAIALWTWSSRGASKISDRVVAGELAYQALPAASVVLASRDADRRANEDPFREPSESSPLPPTRLPFPPLPPLPIVGVPLSPGQEAGAWFQLRVAGGPPTPHAFATPDAGGSDGELPAGDAAGDPAEAAAPANPVVPAAQDENARFDRLYLAGQTRPLVGFVRNTSPDKFEIAAMRGSVRVAVVFEMFSAKTGRSLGSPQQFEPERVDRVELADTLENRIEVARRGLPAGQAGLPTRIEFLERLLTEAREQPWVYEEAERQARALIELTDGQEVGYRWLVRVFRAQGDLERELALYGTLPAGLAESAFRYRSQGVFDARLSLWADAESKLRRAVEIAPNDSRSLAELAQFLMRRGRAAEALPFAERAARNVLQVQEADARDRVGEIVTSAYLAMGRIDDANQALARTSGGNGSAERSYLRGAVAYAAGDIARAKELFERAASEGTILDPVLGLGACQLREAQFDRAKSSFEAVRDRAPLLRARALAALGLLFERTGHDDQALASLEEASRVDPGDPYVLYMLGRAQRLRGELDAAESTLRQALAVRDDIAAAYGEMALVLVEMHRQAGVAGDHLARAARYVDRLVELDARRGAHLGYLEMQGWVHFELGDMNEARRAFSSGAERGSDLSLLGLAILDYAQKRSGEAREQLASIETDPGRAEATRRFARATLDRIDDHASKEQVRDGFARDQLGGLWANGGTLRPQIEDGAVAVRQAQRGARPSEGYARRAVRAMDFLRAEVTLVVRDVAATSEAGLRLAKEDRAGQPFLLTIGLGRSTGQPVPFLLLTDGTTNDGEKPTQLTLDALGSIDFAEPQRLAVEVEPTGDAQGRFVLRVYWNDHLVHTVDGLKGLTPRNTWTLYTDLFAKGTGVDVRFDDYRLVRRKEK